MFQRLTAYISVLVAFTLVTPAWAGDSTGSTTAGFYGGLSLRDGLTEREGVGFAAPATVWNRYAAPVSDDAGGSRALLFGGYRWRNEVAVEAAFSSIDKYALRPADATAGMRGVGLQLMPDASRIGNSASPAWNVDVFTSWTFYKSIALYGRLGYAQAESAPSFGAATLASADRVRLREGVNYGVGLRYDMSSALGLRLEYGRFGRFAGESGPGFPDSDRVTFGVQFRF